MKYYRINEADQWEEVPYETEWKSNLGIDFDIPPTFVGEIDGQRIYSATYNQELQEFLKRIF